MADFDLEWASLIVSWESGRLKSVKVAKVVLIYTVVEGMNIINNTRKLVGRL